MSVPDRVKQYLSQSKPLPFHNEVYIKKVGYLTGSRAFGVGAVDTDYDYIMLAREFEILRLDVDTVCYEGGNYCFEGYRSWYVKCQDGSVLNILAMDSSWYKEQYVYATLWIKKLMANNYGYAEEIKDKIFRVEQFHKFKNEFAAKF